MDLRILVDYFDALSDEDPLWQRFDERLVVTYEASLAELIVLFSFFTTALTAAQNNDSELYEALYPLCVAWRDRIEARLGELILDKHKLN